MRLDGARAPDDYRAWAAPGGDLYKGYERSVRRKARGRGEHYEKGEHVDGWEGGGNTRKGGSARNGRGVSGDTRRVLLLVYKLRGAEGESAEAAVVHTV